MTATLTHPETSTPPAAPPPRPRRDYYRPALAGLLLALCTAGAAAQTVALQGMLGNKALLIVDGGAPRSVVPGETHKGVKVVSTFGDNAVLEFGGKRHTLRVGDAPASVGGSGPAPGGNRIVLSAGTGGHFLTQGAVNGRAVQFMVDTGASAVSSQTARTPSIAWGTRIDQDDRPNTFTDSAIGHNESGVLSTVIEFEASEEPKKNAFHDSDPAWAAAA